MIKLNQYKWVVVADGKLLLTLKGFKPISTFKYAAVRLFPNEAAAINHIQNSKYMNCYNVTYHPVEVSIKEVFKYANTN